MRATIDFGISVGTTSCVVAVSSGGGATVVPNALGRPVTPAAVWIDERRGVRVGEAAKQRALLEGGADAEMGFGRRLGALPSKTEAFESNAFGTSPEELTAELLKALRADVQAYLFEEPQAAVLTLPARSGSPQAAALLRAAQLAGLERAPLLPEPVAASLAHGMQDAGDDAYWLTYDFGGSTFDAALLRARNGAIEIVHTAGDDALGGNSIDSAIVHELLIPALADRFDLPDARPDEPTWRTALGRMRYHAERAKIDVCRKGAAEAIRIEGLCQDRNGADIDLDFELTPEDVARISEPLIERTLTLCRQALDASGLGVSDLAGTLLVGGSTLNPSVANALESELGSVRQEVDPRTVMAQGAALAAGMTLRPGAVERGVERGTIETLVSPSRSPSLRAPTAAATLAVGVPGGGERIIVERGTRLPATGSAELLLDTHLRAGTDDKLLIPLFVDGQPYEQIEIPADELGTDLPAGSVLVLTVHLDEMHQLTFQAAVRAPEVELRFDPPPGQPFLPEGLTDQVNLSITAPAVVTRSQVYLMDVWAHLDGQRQEVEERARAASPDVDVFIRSRGPVRVSRGKTMSVHPRIDGLVLEPEWDTIRWEGQIGQATFTVTVPADASLGPHSGICEFRIDGLKVADLRFLAHVGERSAPADVLPAQERRVRSAYAAYASDDRHAVLGRIQGLQKGAPGLDVFVDVARLRSGQRWQERLRREILSRDVLYLFWSRAASESTWVDWEWRCVLRERGIEFIDPLPLVSPEEVSPPPELAELHFNDWVLAYQRLST